MNPSALPRSAPGLEVLVDFFFFFANFLVDLLFSSSVCCVCNCFNVLFQEGALNAPQLMERIESALEVKQ